MKTKGRVRLPQFVFTGQREIVILVRLSVNGFGREIPVAPVLPDVRIRRTIDDGSGHKKNKRLVIEIVVSRRRAVVVFILYHTRYEL